MPMAVGLSVARESMGTVDVCGDGVLLHVMCLGFPCKV
jgi:thiamine pyrophosphate-dependent acetolactate synthase large subunit-like protein